MVKSIDEMDWMSLFSMNVELLSGLRQTGLTLDTLHRLLP